MWVEYGATRFVLIFNTVVVKFARFRPWRMLARFAHWHRRGGVKGALAKFHVNPLAALALYACSGVRANLIEARISRDFPDLPLARTLYSNGFINIQERAEPADWLSVETMPLKEIAHLYPENPDWWKKKHWGVVAGKVVLLDYGNPEFEIVFHRHFPRVPIGAKVA